MSDQKLRRILSMLPASDEIAERAARARRRALARFEQPQPSRRFWIWAPALATGVLAIAGVLWLRPVRSLPPPEPKAPPAPEIAAVVRPEAPVPAPAPAPKPAARRATPAPSQARLELHLVLSDGTRVFWTIDKNFSL